MRNTIICIIALLMPAMARGGAPDYAYPQTVIANAEAALTKAVARDDGPAKAEALLQIITAKRMIDPDSIAAMPARVSALAAAERDDATRAVLLALEAATTDKAYDSRLYDAALLRLRVQALADSALTLALTLPPERASLSRFSGVVERDALSSRYFTTVADFIAALSTDLNAVSSNFRDEVRHRILATHKPVTAPWAYWTAETMPGAAVDAWLEAYSKCSDAESARIFLVRAAEACSDDNSKSVVAPLLRRSLALFPSYWDNERLRYYLDTFGQPTLSIEYPSIVAPGDTLTITARYANASSIGAVLYKAADAVVAADASITRWLPIDTCSVVTDSILSETTTQLRLVIAEPGTYRLQQYIGALPQPPSAKDKKRRPMELYHDDDLGELIFCTGYVPIALGNCSSQAIITADTHSGAPVGGITVMRGSQPLGITDASGILSLTLPDEGIDAHRNLGFTFIDTEGDAQNFANRITLNVPYGYGARRDSYQAKIFTDRPIYHRGDTLAIAVIAYCDKADGRSRAVEARRELTIIVTNPNGKQVFSADCVTDDMGRAHAAAPLPEGGLTGYYRIAVRSADVKSAYVGSSRVMVSDFKMPQFSAVADSVTIAGDSVRVIGHAVTYAGMPVVGAKVGVTIKNAMRWRWLREGYVEVWAGNATTDVEGHYAISVPLTRLRDSDYDCFVANVHVADAAGNAATASTSFTIGKPCVLQLDTRLENVDAADKLSLTVNAFLPSGEAKAIEARYTLADEATGNVCGQGTFTTGKPFSVNLSKVPAGYYRWTFAAADSTQCDDLDSGPCMLYNSKRGTLPDGVGLLVVNDAITTDSGRAAITLGTAADTSYIYYAVCCGDSLVTVKAHTLRKGFGKIAVALPSGRTSAIVKIISVAAGEVSEQSVRITLSDSKALTLRGESMRTLVTPGATEHLTLKLTDAASARRAGAMIATMYNNALSAIQPMTWPADFSRLMESPRLRADYLWAHAAAYTYGDLPERELTTLNRPTFKSPFDTDYYVANGAMIDMSGPRVLYSARASMKQAAATGVAEAEVAEESAEADAADAGAAEPESRPDDFAYRDTEVLQAFWLPELTIDDDGIATLDFEVPHANTQWELRAFAWTPDVRSAQFTEQITAAKPVMVAMNVPRYLRQGDTADIAATVFNNCGEQRVITTIFDTYDLGGKILGSVTHTDTIGAGASAVVTMPVKAASGKAAMGVRVRATVDQFTDGEQALVAIMPSTATVVESQCFYLNPGDESFSMMLPSSVSQTMTLQYCQNPVWDVVKALPTLVAEKPLCASEASNALFAALVAKGLKAEHAEIADVVDKWQATPADSALVSRLATNESLKIATLEATPWVRAAECSTARMARLQMLFADKAIAASVHEATEVLQRLQDRDGGIRWSAQATEPSLWATESVLASMGLLNEQGFLPAKGKLADIVARAIAYYDKAAFDAKRVCIDKAALAYIHSLYPAIEPSLEAKHAIAECVNDIIANRKAAPSALKARYALILCANGYREVAAEIMRSVSEFAVTTPSQGTSLPSVQSVDAYATLLRAFARLSSDTVLLDGMRQWLVLRTQATERLGAYNPANLVAALLSHGSDWTALAPDDASAVTINGHALATDRVASATGYIIATLPAAASGAELTVTPALKVPSYGSVMTVRSDAAAAIAAHATDDIAITKRFMVRDDAAAGGWRQTSVMHRGDRVQVVITIDVKRDMQYVTIIDERPATLEPTEQLPGYIRAEGLNFYRENRDATTNIFIDRLPRGVYNLAIDMTAGVSGTFTSGVASLQSQLAPELTAHSAGTMITVK
ncbi:MAG: alpha-2-macroglobulin family protein [Muribaculaceae bacterium]